MADCRVMRVRVRRQEAGQTGLKRDTGGQILEESHCVLRVVL